MSRDILDPKYINIYEKLESEIISLELKPGDLISENSLCERFNVSRTPIRAVIQRLSQTGFVDISPRKASVVSKIDYKIVSQLIYQRKAVEYMVIRDYMRSAGPADIEKLRNHINKLNKIYDKGMKNQNFDAHSFRKEDLKMHEIWFDYTQNMYLWESLTKTQSSYSRFCMLDLMEEANYEYIIKEHEKLLDIIESKDESSIEAFLSKHLYGGITRLGGKIFNEFKDYFIPESIDVFR